MKIRIIGHAGSGKTTLSKELNEAYGYHSVPLDSFLKHKDKKKRKVLLQKELTAHQNWVVEGVQQQQWCQETVTGADLIILLDYPLYLVQYRVIKRTIQKWPKASKKRKAFLKRRAQSLLKWNRKFTKNMPRLKHKLHHYNSNLYVIRGPKDLERVHTIINFYIK